MKKFGMLMIAVILAVPCLAVFNSVSVVTADDTWFLRL